MQHNCTIRRQVTQFLFLSPVSGMTSYLVRWCYIVLAHQTVSKSVRNWTGYHVPIISSIIDLEEFSDATDFVASRTSDFINFHDDPTSNGWMPGFYGPSPKWRHTARGAPTPFIVCSWMTEIRVSDIAIYCQNKSTFYKNVSIHSLLSFKCRQSIHICHRPIGIFRLLEACTKLIREVE